MTISVLEKFVLFFAPMIICILNSIKILTKQEHNKSNSITILISTYITLTMVFIFVWIYVVFFQGSGFFSNYSRELYFFLSVIFVISEFVYIFSFFGITKRNHIIYIKEKNKIQNNLSIVSLCFNIVLLMYTVYIFKFVRI